MCTIVSLGVGSKRGANFEGKNRKIGSARAWPRVGENLHMKNQTRKLKHLGKNRAKKPKHFVERKVDAHGKSIVIPRYTRKIDRSKGDSRSTTCYKPY